MKHILVLILLLLTLTSCGGSSGSDNDSSSNPDNIMAKVTITDDSFAINQAVELILHAPQSTISNIKWSQLSGHPSPLLSATSKALAVTPTVSGNYQFQVSFLDNGQAKTLTAEFSVPEQQAMITVPNGQAVLTGNKVSLRAFAYNGEMTKIEWRQTAGSKVTLTNDELTQPALIFQAPAVEQDSIISFEVTAEIANQSYTDTVSILIESAPEIANNAYFDERVANVFPYKADSPHAKTLVDCVYSNTLTSSCQLSQLPLIAHTSSEPTVDDIMDRVVVSHQWMGDNFKAFLENHDPHNDFKRLLRAATAIVISYDIRPSFYWAATGAIYLDAENFWLTPAQRDTISEAPDYRSNFGNDLQFLIPWRYVKDNNYAFSRQSYEVRTERSTADLTYGLGFLLYHELAHANDFFPPRSWNSLDSNERVLDLANSHTILSEQLSSYRPLNSQVLKDLAQVNFAGSNATT